MHVAKNRQLQREDYQSVVKTVSRHHSEVFTQAWINETDKFSTIKNRNNKKLMNEICNIENLTTACKFLSRKTGTKSKSNIQLLVWLENNHETLINKMMTGKYKPRKIYQLDDRSKKNRMGQKPDLPAMIDLMVQQAITQILTPIYEPTFSRFSYGFRKQEKAHDALHQLKAYAEDNKSWAVHIKFTKRLDVAAQSKLVQLLSDRLVDKQVVSLIHRFLLAGVLVDGVVQKTEIGTPKRGSLAPLLTNILLNRLDEELEARGHAFVRHGDDCMIFKQSRKAAERTLSSVSRFIKATLFLGINEEKTRAGNIANSMSFLGYSFDFQDEKLMFQLSNSSKNKLLDKVRNVLARSNGWPIAYRQHRFSRLIFGWIHHFKLADMQASLRSIDIWCHAKIRCYYWKQWKRTRTKIKMLQGLGMSRNNCYQLINDRKAYWHVANSASFSSVLTDASLEAMGWWSFGGHLKAVTKQ